MDEDFAPLHAPGDPAVAVASALPAHSQQPIKARTWLMDSGASLDLISKSDIAPHADLVRKGEKVMLDTANGEYLASKRIDLHLGVLGESISPYVLKSTPPVLSLGRRVVEQG